MIRVVARNFETILTPRKIDLGIAVGKGSTSTLVASFPANCLEMKLFWLLVRVSTAGKVHGREGEK